MGSGFPLGRTPMPKPENLGEAVQRYGYAKKQKIKLYGKELEIVSDPVNTAKTPYLFRPSPQLFLVVVLQPRISRDVLSPRHSL